MSAAGHEVFLFRWGSTANESDPILPAERVREITLSPGEVENAYPAGPPATALSHHLRPHIARCVEQWEIDVVECADQGFGAYAFFQEARTRARHGHLVLASYLHGLNLQAFAANLAFPDRVASDDLGSQRHMLRLSDVVIAPSRRAAEVARGLGVESRVEVVAPPMRFEPTPGTGAFSGRVALVGPIEMSRGLDAAALFVNQISADFPLREIYLIGEDAGTTLRRPEAVDLFASRLKLAAEVRLVATGALKREDALDLLHASDWLCAFDQSEAFDHFPLQALDRGLFPLARQGSPLAELFPEDLADCLLPTDLSNRREVVACCQSIQADKARKTARLQSAIAERAAPAVFSAKVGAIYAEIAGSKTARTRRRTAARPTIAVLIPAHNPPEIFAETLDSLARQTRAPDRVILCDVGSTTDMDRWRGRVGDLPLTLIRQRNLGLSGARNTLIDACDAELALFLDCDDQLEPPTLERLEEAFHVADRPEAVIPGRRMFGESQEIVLRHQLGDHLHYLRNEYRMTALIKSETLREIRFAATRRDGEADDWVFWLTFAARGFRAEFDPEPLFRYRFTSGSMSWPWSVGQAAGTAAMIAELIAATPPSARSARLLSWALYEFHAALDSASRK
jgi:hypothetical protein